MVIANAGICLKQKLLIDTKQEEIESVITTNLKGTILTNKHAVLSMLSSGGRIINVSSIFGLGGGSCEVAYSSSKAGVIGLTKSLSQELSSSNVEVCAVAFGLVDTPMNSHFSTEDKLEFIKDCNLEKVPSASDASLELYQIAKSDESINGKIFSVFN